MTKIIGTAFALSALFIMVASNAMADTVSYRDAVKACGAEWKQSDARKSVAKGEGQKAWNEFRAKCVTEKGYVKGARAR